MSNVNMIGINELGKKRTTKNDEMRTVYCPNTGKGFEHTFRNAKELVQLSGFTWTSAEDDAKAANERLAEVKKANKEANQKAVKMAEAVSSNEKSSAPDKASAPVEPAVVPSPFSGKD